MDEPATPSYVATVDHALTTTRAVRMRLDFDRPVDDQTILDCIDVAEQAPTGGNTGSRRWIVVRDPATKDRLAELYLRAGGEWVVETADRLAGTDHPNARMMQGAKHLAVNLARAPALVIPTIIGRHDASGRPGLFDSVIQSGWSFMVALRARGLGSTWTTMFLNEADAVAELLGIPDHVTQICLFPVAYTLGTDFRPTTRRHPARDITYFERFGVTEAVDGSAAVVAETDVGTKPAAVEAALASSSLGGLRRTVEQIPGGTRVRVHRPLDAGAGAEVDPMVGALAARHELEASLADALADAATA